MEQYTIPMLRFIIIFPLLYLVTIIMGKRSIGELPVIDFIVVITIGNVVGADIADPEVPHGPTALMVVLIGLTQYLITWAKRSNSKVRDLSTITPTVIIQSGKFLTHNISKIRYTVHDILPMLREQGVFNVSEVQLAIIEPSGKLSVMKRAQSRPITPKDLGRTPTQESLPLLLIVDGQLVPNSLKYSDKDLTWLHNQLKKLGYNSIEDIYLAAVETDGTFYASPAKQQQPGKSIHY